MSTDQNPGRSIGSSLIEALADLERNFIAGHDRPTEEVLAKHPELANDPDAALELIYTEHVLRQEAGGELSPDAWFARFPEWREELHKLLHVHQFVIDSATDQQRSTGPQTSEETWTGHAARVGPPPKHLGDYELLERIGRGGMGVVYRARQRKLDRIVAVKTIAASEHCSAKSIARFEAEAQAAARLQHPHITQIYEVGISQGIPYFSMEYASDGNLTGLTQERPFEPIQAAVLVERLARAVHYAHGQGIVHRDLKPANILITRSQHPESIRFTPADCGVGEAALGQTFLFEPKIADFGLAKRTDELTPGGATNMALGTPSYMAPEQVDSTHGQVGPACDIYGLGAILYAVLVGRPPFKAPSVLETLHLVTHEDPVPPRDLQPRLPRDLETICLVCLRKDPARRYASAAELADDLRRFLAGEPILARVASHWERTIKWVRRYPAAAALIGTILLATLGTGSQWVRAEANHRAERTSHQTTKRLLYSQRIALVQQDLDGSNLERARDRLNETRPEFRHWEWNYLYQQCYRELREFHLTPIEVGAVALSPDGTLVAGGSRGPWGVNQPSQLKVWDVNTGQNKYLLHGHPSAIMDLRFSPDGRSLASTGVYWKDPHSKGGLRVWNMETGELRFSIPELNAFSVAYSPDGKSLAVGLSRGEIQWYSADTGELVRTFKGHRGIVFEIAYRPDGKFFASASRDGTMRVWSTDSRLEHPVVSGLSRETDMRRLDWSPNGRDVVVTGYRGSLRFFRQTDDAHVVEVSRLDRTEPIQAVKYSPDGLFLVTAIRGEPINFLDARTREVVGRIRSHNGYAMDVAFDRQGRRIATSGGDGVVRVWDLANDLDRPAPRGRHAADVIAIAVHPERAQAALALGLNPRWGASASGKPRVEIVDLLTNESRMTLQGPRDWLTAVAFHPHGSQVAAGGNDKTVQLWDASDGKLLRTFAGHTNVITGVAFVQGGTRVASSSQDRTVQIWNTATGAVEHLWNADDQEIVCLAAAPDGRVLAVATSDSMIRFLDTESGETLPTCRRGQGRVRDLRFDPGGMVLAAAKADGTVDLWSVTSVLNGHATRPEKILRGHTEQISSVAFSPDGQRLASSSSDRTVKLWDVQSGEQLLSFIGTHGLQSRVGFSADGRILKKWDWDRSQQWTIDGTSLPPIGKVANAKPATDLDWHTQQLVRGVRANNPFAEVYHLTRLMELEPANSHHQRARGEARIKLGDFDMAEQDLLATLERTDDVQLRMTLARVQLQLGKVADYRAQCRQLERGYRNSQQAGALSGLARIASLTPESGVDVSALLDDLEKSVAQKPVASLHNTIALVLYRSGRTQEAIEHAKAAIALDPTTNIPFNWIVLALCHAQKGESTEFQAQLARVHDWLDQQKRLSQAGLDVTSMYEDYTQPDLLVLLKEAEDIDRGREDRSR